MAKSETFVKSPADGRGQATRERLLNVGLDVFGTIGYEAASTRILAKRAGVNLAAIAYHFGGKEGLYRSVIQLISDTIAAYSAEKIRTVRALLDDPNASREALFDALELLLRTFGRFIIGSEQASKFGAVLVREQMRPTPAFDLLYHGGIGLGHLTLCRLVGRLTNRTAEDPETVVLAHTILGQVAAFRALREIALRRLGQKQFSAERVEDILNTVVNNCRVIFGVRQRRRP